MTKQFKKKWKNYKLLLWLMPFMILVLLFSYVPLFGWVIAFFDYQPGRALSSEYFVGLKYFKMLFTDSINMGRVFKNTIIFASLAMATSIFPVMFAMALNDITNKKFSKTIQTITTLPNFISWVIVSVLAFTMFSSNGVVNDILMQFGIISKPTNVMGNSDAVYLFQTFLGLWKGLGWSSIVYLAAISGIPQELYEAASVDGATRFQKTIYITLPGVMETYIVLLLLSIGNFISVGFDQYFLFSNPAVMRNIEVIDLYVYRLGLLNKSYSYSTAIGMTKSLISLCMIFGANRIAKKVRGESIL